MLKGYKRSNKIIHNIKECRNAGAQYYKLPTKPVHSIAHYKNGEYPSFFEYHETKNDGKLIKYVGNKDFEEYENTLPNQIEFIEYNRIGQYFREPKPYGTSYMINKWSADVMVDHQVIQLQKAIFFKTDIYKHYLTIKDHRNGEVLARLLYVVDNKNDLACGFTGDNKIDEKYFVLKAIGLEK